MASADKSDIGTWSHTPAGGAKVPAGTVSPKAGWLGNLQLIKEYINDLLARFRVAAGHTHTGVDGDGPKIPVGSLDTTGTTQGDIAYRGASAWASLAVDSVGKFLRSGGSAANPTFAYALPDYKRFYVSVESVNAAGSGSGAGTNYAAGYLLDTGVTGSSVYRIYAAISSAASPVNAFYNNNPSFSVTIERIAGDSSAQKVFRVGTGLASYNATATTKSFGFRLDGNTLKAVNADGTTETSTDVSSGITLANVNHLHAVMTSATNIKFYINGTLVATHTTNLPTGNEQYAFTARVDNGSDTAALTIFATVPSISFSI